MNALGRFAYRIVSIIGRFIPFWSRHRVRIVVKNNHDEVLLVKNWLSLQQWSLPGGGIAHNESSRQAAVRELYEETGLRVEPHQLSELATMHEPTMKMVLTIFQTTIANTALNPIHFPHSLEIISSQWFPLSSLPRDTNNVANQAIRLALDEKS